MSQTRDEWRLWISEVAADWLCSVLSWIQPLTLSKTKTSSARRKVNLFSIFRQNSQQQHDIRNLTRRLEKFGRQTEVCEIILRLTATGQLSANRDAYVIERRMTQRTAASTWQPISSGKCRRSSWMRVAGCACVSTVSDRDAAEISVKSLAASVGCRCVNGVSNADELIAPSALIRFRSTGGLAAVYSRTRHDRLCTPCHVIYCWRLISRCNNRCLSPRFKDANRLYLKVDRRPPWLQNVTRFHDILSHPISHDSYWSVISAHSLTPLKPDDWYRLAFV